MNTISDYVLSFIEYGHCLRNFAMTDGKINRLIDRAEQMIHS